MRIGRTLPPAAAPLAWRDLARAVAGAFSPERALRALEDDLRRHFGVRRVFLTSSGTAALALALRALKRGSARTEVVVPAYTCFSVPAAVVRAGLRPVLCDVDPETFDFDHALLERACGPNTLCVVAHHLFGIPSDVERVRDLCAPRGIFVVEDAAQAMGIEAGGRPLGTLGDVGIFSLGRGKNITCGSGGVIVTRSRRAALALGRAFARLDAPGAAETLKDLARIALMALFIRPGLYWIPAALPFLGLGRTVYPRKVAIGRLSGMKAGLLREWRRRLAAANCARAEAAADLARRVGLQPPAGASHPYLRLPVLLSSADERERIHARARARGLGLAAAYPTPVSDIPELRPLFDERDFPAARRVAERLLTLPTHHWVSEDDRRAIAECVRGTAAPSGARAAWARAS